MHWKALWTFSTKIQVNQSHPFFFTDPYWHCRLQNNGKVFGTLLEISSECSWVLIVTAGEYKILCKKDFLEKGKEVKFQRVDDFYATIFSKGEDY